MAKKIKQKLKRKYKVRRVFLIVVFLGLLVLLGWYIVRTGLFGLLKPEGETSSPDESGSLDELGESEPSLEDPDSSEPPSEAPAPLPQPQEPGVSPDSWNLILVNPDNTIPADFAVQLATIYDGHKVDARIAAALQEMLTDAKLRDIVIYPRSAYRTLEEQQHLYDQKVEEYMSAGSSEAEARMLAATVVALPNCSEHQTGLAIDLVSTTYTTLDEGFENTEAFRWLNEHAHEYGFVLRFPKDKGEYTKIIYEPWHYRYVGLENAAVMKEKGYCLEEYISILRSGLDPHALPTLEEGAEAGAQEAGEETPVQE